MLCTSSTPWSTSESTSLTCQQCRSAPLKAQTSLGRNLRKLVAIDYRCLSWYGVGGQRSRRSRSDIYFYIFHEYLTRCGHERRLIGPIHLCSGQAGFLASRQSWQREAAIQSTQFNSGVLPTIHAFLSQAWSLGGSQTLRHRKATWFNSGVFIERMQWFETVCKDHRR